MRKFVAKGKTMPRRFASAQRLRHVLRNTTGEQGKIEPNGDVTIINPRKR